MPNKKFDAINAAALIQTHVGPRDRVLITGATGWFGLSALEALRTTGAKILPLGSKARTLTAPSSNWDIKVWESSAIEDFAPTICVDTAFLTRDKYDQSHHGHFLETNRMLAERAFSVLELPSLRRFIGFSSGASITEPSHPYGALKLEYESKLAELSLNARASVVIARVWSVSGPHANKRSTFAFSQIIDQAMSGLVRLESTGLVFRRYCSIEDFLAVCLSIPVNGKARLVESGGELIELANMAAKAISLLNPSSQLELPDKREKILSAYYSDNSNWEEACRDLGLVCQSLEQQIITVAGTSPLTGLNAR